MSFVLNPMLNGSFVLNPMFNGFCFESYVDSFSDCAKVLGVSKVFSTGLNFIELAFQTN